MGSNIHDQLLGLEKLCDRRKEAAAAPLPLVDAHLWWPPPLEAAAWLEQVHREQIALLVQVRPLPPLGHPLLLPPRQHVLAELGPDLDDEPEPQLARPAEQLLLLPPQELVARPLPVRDEDGRPVRVRCERLLPQHRQPLEELLQHPLPPEPPALLKEQPPQPERHPLQKGVPRPFLPA